MTAILFCVLLAVVATMDIRSRTIPDWIPLGIALLALPSPQWGGLLLALLFYLSAMGQPEGMGGGDIKLVAAAGLYLGLSRGAMGVVLALVLAVLYSLAKRIPSRTPLPLAPFLAVGFAAAYFI